MVNSQMNETSFSAKLQQQRPEEMWEVTCTTSQQQNRASCRIWRMVGDCFL